MFVTILLSLQRPHVINQRLSLLRRKSLRFVSRHVRRLLRLFALQNYLYKFLIFVVRVELLFCFLTVTNHTPPILVVRSPVSIFHISLSSAGDQEDQGEDDKTGNGHCCVL